METKQFISISKEGENSQIEYKTCYDQISYSLYESVCSFLNHNGGYILIGVNDKGKIIGLNPDKIQDMRNNIITTVKNKDLFMPTIYLTPEIVLRYAPLYNSSYKVEILNGSHFIFSITYVKMSLQNNENVLTNQKMSLQNDENVLTNLKMSPENDENVLTNLKMSPENDIKDLESDELDIRLDYIPTKKLKNKEYKRHLQIVELIIANPQITIDEISEKLKVNERTIRRDIDKLSSIIEHVGPNKGGYWKVNK